MIYLKTLYWYVSDRVDIFLKQTGFSLYPNNTLNLRRPLSPHAMLYPQNGDRILTVDSVTSLHPVCSNRPIHTAMPDTTQTALFYRVWCGGVNWALRATRRGAFIGHARRRNSGW